MLENGATVDSNEEKDDPFKFILGNHHVIRGWDEGVITMRVGEKATFKIHSELAYGKMGSPPKIPSDANMVFRVELINFHDRRVTKWMMTDEEKIAATLKLKDDGNLKFKEQKYKEAEGFYQDALLHLDQMKQANPATDELVIKLYVNIAISNNMVKDYKQAHIYADKAVKKDPANVKALYNRALSASNLSLFEEANGDFKKVLQKNPDDVKAKQEFEKMKKNRTAYLKKQQGLLKGLFDGGVYEDKKVVTLHSRLPDYQASNPHVFLEIVAGETADGEENVKVKFVFELFKQFVPKTVENFRALCTGEKGEPLYYKNNVFHRIISNFMMQGGDTTNQDGTGGKSIYGEKFADEPDFLPHTSGGLLSMANAGPNTNGSQFFITFAPTPHLDKKHIVFGRIVKGREELKKFDGIKTGANDKPFKEVKIVDCGMYTEKLAEDELELE